jgi:hypothetical protein
MNVFNHSSISGHISLFRNGIVFEDERLGDINGP